METWLVSLRPSRLPWVRSISMMEVGTWARSRRSSMERKGPFSRSRTMLSATDSPRPPREVKGTRRH